jgi:DNA-binding LytR/AlgR family response regulator
MSDISCLIVDDEPIARDIIRQFVEDTPGLTVDSECSNALELMEVLKNRLVDVIFLDINMPKLTGIEFLRTQQLNSKVILTTAFPEFALDGYELNVVDYLLKPIAFPRFLQAIDKVKQEVHVRKEFNITVKSDGKSYRINVRDILWVESKGDYLMIHTSHQRIVVYMTMKKFMEKTDTQLQRVHKSWG